ncbi:MAG: hypothetical protein GDA49_01825 [Rhodospirillales bacterium]|nr:hypothetical protein [Rhodospirillales bacterium]
MKRLLSRGAALAAVAALAPPVSADDIGSIITPSGVSVQTHVESGDRLVIAVVPTMDVRLNGRLGIGLTPLDDQMIWLDEMPSVLMVEGDHFDGAVLQTLTFDPAHLNGSSSLGITFGACLPVSGVCILEEAKVTLARSTEGDVNLTLAGIAP